MSDSDVVLRVEGLGKMYRIGIAEKRPTNLREAVRYAAGAPFRYLRTHLSEATEEEIIWALKDVSFEVKRGDVVGIIGKNGAGKTTLLRILSRITDPTEGRAVIHGRVNSLLEVGTGFHPELTGRENVYLTAAIHGMRKAEIDRQFDEILDFAGIEKFIDTPIKRYSTGMVVRLGFAVAAFLRPEVLIVDEVLAVGDYEFQQRCLGKMGEMKKDGRTVLLVSHSMPSVMQLCRRALLLRQGRIDAQGSVREVVEHYLSTGRSGGGEIVWNSPADAPGDDRARLHAVRILQDGIGAPTENVDVSKEVIIQIEYWCLQENLPLCAGFELKDRLGVVIFACRNAKSMNLIEDPWYGRPHPRGLFRSVCRIPANFLNEASYMISAGLAKVNEAEGIAYAEDILSFMAHDVREMWNKRHGGWTGLIRPSLYWHTERIG